MYVHARAELEVLSLPFRPSAVTALADGVGVGIHYNTLIPWSRQPNPGNFASFKYGVIGVDRLCQDLSGWGDMFVAGRMQKPVATLGEADPRVAAAAAANLRAALAATLLTLPETFTTRQLHRQLCGLSYFGDIRMSLFAEDADKIARIASGSRAGLLRLYGDAVVEMGAGPVGLTRTEGPADGGGGGGGAGAVRKGEGEDGKGGLRGGDGEEDGSRWWGQDKGESARRWLLMHLPEGLLACVGQRMGTSLLPDSPSSSSSSNHKEPIRGLTDAAEMEKTTTTATNPRARQHVELATALARTKDAGCDVSASHALSDALRESLGRVVQRASLRQLLASALTTSPDKAAQYAASKIVKSLVSRVIR